MTNKIALVVQIKTRLAKAPILVLMIAIVFVVSVGLACNAPADESLDQTQVAINVQATVLAQQTEQSQQLTQAAQVDQPAESDQQSAAGDAKATLVALEAQMTLAAQQAAAQAQVAAQTHTPTTTTQPPAPTQEPPPTQSGVNDVDFDTWMRSASILLYEDMSGDFSVSRFIKPALDGMSLQYVDVKDALGHYKTQLLSGGPGGQGWDLIISGKEHRTSVQGEFYVYLNDALNQGSSIIIEEWDMDSIASGKISTILSRCGVKFQADWIDEPLDEQLLFPINGSLPVHHFPNEGISLTNPSGYWMWTDLGDLMSLRPGSDAQMLWGARTNATDSYATAASCLDGRLIIQTYSSHSYGQDRIVLMWQNYIYNTLQARYEYLAAH